MELNAKMVKRRKTCVVSEVGQLERPQLVLLSFGQAYTLHKYLDRKKCVDTLVYWKNVVGTRSVECGELELGVIRLFAAYMKRKCDIEVVSSTAFY